MVEEKGPFVETALKETLYGAAHAPRIVGKRDEHGERLLPAEVDLDADVIARAVAARLGRRVQLDSVEAHIRRLDSIAGRRGRAADGPAHPVLLLWMPAQLVDQGARGHARGAAASAATRWCCSTPRARARSRASRRWAARARSGSAWRPSPRTRHLVQNLGDGTFHHSGSLAVRAAVAAGVNITYKLLYNEHVAMTGGQAIEGQLSVPDLTRWLELEGVRRIIVTAEDTSRYKGVSLSPIAELRERGELLSSQLELAEVEGVTVLIHDQECAAELRRSRKRGKQARAGRAHLDQRARLRGLRRLWREVELPVGPAGGDGVRPQDPDPPGLVQQGLLLPRGRLPLVPHRGPRREGQARDSHVGRRAARARAIGLRRGLGRAHDGHRRHRSCDREPDARHGCPDRRPARIGPRPDGSLAEGRAGGVRPAHLARAAGCFAQGDGGLDRPLPRLRPARCRQRQEPGYGVTGPHRRRGVHKRRSHRPHGRRHQRALPGARGPARQDRCRDPARAQPLPRRPAPLRTPLRRPHDDQHARPRRGLPARAAARVARGPRAGDSPQRRRGREEPLGLRLGSRGGRCPRYRRGGDSAAGDRCAGARAQRDRA